MTAPAIPSASDRPVRDEMLPYGRQSIDEEDIAAVVEVLRSDWLTTGPKVDQFQNAFAEFCGVSNAVAVNSGTAALHAMMHGIGIKPGDEVIVPAITFVATANSVVYCGGAPVFADVEADTLLLDPQSVKRCITPRTKAIVAVDYAGQPCDYDALRMLADEHGLRLLADGCHAPGATFKGRRVGSIADATAFSFHPVKHITCGEGGAVTTDDAELAQRMRTFRNHGITADFRQRDAKGSWSYEMVELGFNFRITDFQCALVLSQLGKLERRLQRRQEIAALYDSAFANSEKIQPLAVRPNRTHAHHLYVVRIHGRNRDLIFTDLRKENIGAQVHYMPVHLHPFYREKFGTKPGLCPVAESVYLHILSLPIFPAMTDSDADDVIAALSKVFG